MRHVAVAGGGLAGLTAALELARAGARVTVVEAAERLGGRLGADAPVRVVAPSGREHLFPDEHGLHAIWRQYWNVRRQLAELRVDHHLVDPGTQEHLFPDRHGALRRVDIGDRVRRSRLPAPLAVLRPWTDPDLVRILVRGGFGPLARMVPALLGAFVFDPADPRALAAWDRRTIADLVAGWPPECVHLFASLSHAAYFDEPDRVSLAALGLGLRFYFLDHRTDSRFDVLDEDADAVWLRPLAAELRRRGVTVATGTRALRVEVADGRATALHVEGAGALAVDGLVIALDPGAAHALGGDGPLALPRPPEGLRSVVVRQWLPGRVAPDRAASGMMAGLDAAAFFWLDRFQRSARGWADDTGGSVLELHLYGDRARLASADAARSAGALVARLWPEVGVPLHTTVRQNPATQVAFPPGAVGALPTRWTALPNVVRCGDGVALEWPALFLERACATAVEAARELARELHLDAVPPALRLEAPELAVSALRGVARRLPGVGA